MSEHETISWDDEFSRIVLGRKLYSQVKRGDLTLEQAAELADKHHDKVSWKL